MLTRGGGGGEGAAKDVFDERSLSEGDGGEKEEDLHPLEDVTDADSVTLYPCAAITFIEAAEEQWASEQAWGLPDVAITLLLYAAVVLIFVFAPSEVAEAVSYFVLMAAYLASTWAALAGWPALASWQRGNGPAVDFGMTLRWMHIAWGAAYGCACIGVAVVLAVVTQMVFGKFDSNAGDVLTSGRFSPNETLVFLCLVAFGAPVVEEISFRGLVFCSLAKSLASLPYHPLLVGFLTAVYFAAFHMEPVRLPLLLGVALVLSLARYHTASLTAPIVAHMMLNSLPLLLFCWMLAGVPR